MHDDVFNARDNPHAIRESRNQALLNVRIWAGTIGDMVLDALCWTLLRFSGNWSTGAAWCFASDCESGGVVWARWSIILLWGNVRWCGLSTMEFQFAMGKCQVVCFEHDGVPVCYGEMSGGVLWARWSSILLWGNVRWCGLSTIEFQFAMGNCQVVWFEHDGVPVCYGEMSGGGWMRYIQESGLDVEGRLYVLFGCLI
jgi:hypothetical protein